MELSWWYEPGCMLRSSPRSPRRVEETPHFFVRESTDTEVVRSMTEKDEGPAVSSRVKSTPTKIANSDGVCTGVPRMA